MLFQIELEEIEAQVEEYSETRGFLGLLNNLTDVPIPVSLGAGHRVPGFQPYLEFVRDSVFLKFDSRGYKNSQEKVSQSLCICMIDVHLDDYSSSGLWQVQHWKFCTNFSHLIISLLRILWSDPISFQEGVWFSYHSNQVTLYYYT